MEQTARLHLYPQATIWTRTHRHNSPMIKALSVPNASTIANWARKQTHNIIIIQNWAYTHTQTTHITDQHCSSVMQQKKTMQKSCKISLCGNQFYLLTMQECHTQLGKLCFVIFRRVCDRISVSPYLTATNTLALYSKSSRIFGHYQSTYSPSWSIKHKI